MFCESTIITNMHIVMFIFVVLVAYLNMGIVLGLIDQKDDAEKVNYYTL